MASMGRNGWRAMILAITICGGVAGGLLGERIWPLNALSRPWWLVLIVSTALGATVAVGLLTVEPSARHAEPETRPRTDALAGDPGPAGPNQTTATDQRHRLPGTPSQLAVPLQDPGGTPSKRETRQWWTETSPNATNRRTAPESAAGQAPPLSSYSTQQAQIAQCPSCGSFELDMARSGPAYAFRCRNSSCANTWSWTPGTPWPAVVVRLNLAGGSAERA